MGGQRGAPTALPPGKNRYPLYRKLGGPQGRSGRVHKISVPPRLDLRAFQAVASRYTECAILAHQYSDHFHVFIIVNNHVNKTAGLLEV
jgi:hypothetical protein